MAGETRVAVLIDCDNISAKHAQTILAETAAHGTLSIKRAYGDWVGSQLSGWKPELFKLAIQPVQQFAYVTGKNATDTALIIDAMDLLYSGNVDAFCIVSSDSDFTRLAMRLRESGRRVYGIGAQKTPESFTNACDRFTFLEVLLEEPQAENVNTVNDIAPTLPNPRPIVTAAIKATAADNGWAQLSTVGSFIVNNHPTFDSRNYGFAKLGALMRSLPFVEVGDTPDAKDLTQPRVRLRPQKETPAKKAPAKKAMPSARK
ncbi:NYN domain-containing protein [Knoellia locipacati]|uniref:NYN domain-containing protein n=1 Tax=Knoellia locipacati TaxID=882824 RepID=UPI00384C5EE4